MLCWRQQGNMQQHCSSACIVYGVLPKKCSICPHYKRRTCQQALWQTVQQQRINTQLKQFLLLEGLAHQGKERGSPSAVFSHQHIVQQHVPPVCYVVAPARAHAALSLCMRHTLLSIKVSILVSGKGTISRSLLHSEVFSHLSCCRCPRSQMLNQRSPLTKKCS